MGLSQEAVDSVISLVLSRFTSHRRHHHHQQNASSSSPSSSSSSPAQPRRRPPRPFVLGLSGMQGSGKSTWAQKLASDLRSRPPPPPHAHDDGNNNLKVLVLSIDDLYRDHSALQKLKADNPENELYRNRGQPGTHDEELAARFFAAAGLGGEGEEEEEGSSSRTLKIPSYDKSAHNGQGDRVPESEWEVWRGGSEEEGPEEDGRKKELDIIIFEGWCVGFRALSEEALEAKWSTAAAAAAAAKAKAKVTEGKKQEEEEEEYEYNTNTLPLHPLSSLKTINANLKRYNETFLGPKNFDYLVHLDTKELKNVYKWRVQQEQALREQKRKEGKQGGMTDEEVIKFVEVYMPAYELYLEGLRTVPGGFFSGDDGGNKEEKRQVRVLLDEGRGVEGIEEM